MRSGSKLERVLEAGHFAFTGELGPPRGSNPDEVREKAKHLVGMVDAVNITDNQTAMVRMASWAASLLAIESGLEPNFQMVCRDRNRLAMQADVLGASAMGIRNMLCLSGDHQMFGDHPDAKGVFDVDSIQLLSMVRAMRDDGAFQSGQEIDTPPKLFLGAASNPFAEPHEWRVQRLAKKVAAGADFIQTQCIYNMDRFRDFVKKARDAGLLDRTHLLAGVTPLKSIGMARYMQKKVPGMDVPEALITRLKGAKGKGKGSVAKEGIQIAVEQIQELKEMGGIAGVHLMAIDWEHRVPEIAEAAGLLPRPEA